MKRFMIWFCLTLVVITILLISLAGCKRNPCVLGDACEAGIMQPINATLTSAALEWHIQQTEMAK